MPTAVVTGAFSFSGRAIARRLLARGWSVRTLTGRRPDPALSEVAAYPLRLDDPRALAERLRGAQTLYNTYWIRFPYRGLTYERAIAGSAALLAAAREAGVKRVVHVSIANVARGAGLGLPYYRGKADVERLVETSDLSYALLRPTVLFGTSDGLTDVLVNNLAWFVRTFPVVAVPGTGSYGIQPVSVDDLADLAVEAGLAEGHEVCDVAGPETFTFADLLTVIGEAIGRPRPVLRLPPVVLHLALRAAGPALGDVVLTREEIRGLMAGLLVSGEEPRGRTRLSEWLAASAADVGRHYASELARHYRAGQSSRARGSSSGS